MGDIMRKIMGMVLASMTLAGCENPVEKKALARCRTALESELKSPASLSIVESFAFALPEEASVYITYDAANSFGAMLRGRKTCHYSVNSLGELGASQREETAKLTDQEMEILNRMNANPNPVPLF